MAKIETQYVLVGRDQTKRAMSSFRRNVNRAQQAVFSLRGALVGLGAAAAVRSIAEAGLAIERIEQGLKFATGSADAAARELAFVRAEAERLGISFETAATSFTRLSAAAKGTAVEGKTTRDIFVGLSEASRVLGLSADQTEGAFVAIEQIISKGKVSAEELRQQLGERLFGAFQIAARSINVTTEELDELLRQGKLASSQLLPALARELRSTFAAEVPDAAQSAAASFERFSSSIFDLQVALAQSGLLDLLATAADSFTTLTQSVTEFFTTTRTERIAQLRSEIAQLNSTIANNANLGAEYGLGEAAIRQLEKKREALQFELELQQTRLEREEAAKTASDEGTASINEQAVAVANLVEQVQILAKTPQDLKAYYDSLEFRPLSIETQLDRDLEAAGLRESTASVQELQRSFSLLAPEVEQVSQAAVDLGFTFQSAFEDAILEGENLRTVLQGLLKDIARIALRTSITQPLGNFFGGFFGNFFGGGRASGGPVIAGTGYLVGEKGPELFVPRVSGTIVPSAAGGVSIHNNINIDSRTDRQQIAAELAPVLARTSEATIERVRGLIRQGRLA